MSYQPKQLSWESARLKLWRALVQSRVLSQTLNFHLLLCPKHIQSLISTSSCTLLFHPIPPLSILCTNSIQLPVYHRICSDLGLHSREKSQSDWNTCQQVSEEVKILTCTPYCLKWSVRFCLDSTEREKPSGCYFFTLCNVSTFFVSSSGNCFAFFVFMYISFPLNNTLIQLGYPLACPVLPSWVLSLVFCVFHYVGSVILILVWSYLFQFNLYLIQGYGGQGQGVGMSQSPRKGTGVHGPSQSFSAHSLYKK